MAIQNKYLGSIEKHYNIETVPCIVEGLTILVQTMLLNTI